MERAECLRNEAFCVSFPAMLFFVGRRVVIIFRTIRLLYPNIGFRFTLSSHWQVLSLFLLVRCQINLCSDELLDTMNLIRCLHNDEFDNDFCFVDRLILELTYRSLKLYRGRSSPEGNLMLMLVSSGTSLLAVYSRPLSSFFAACRCQHIDSTLPSDG